MKSKSLLTTKMSAGHQLTNFVNKDGIVLGFMILLFQLIPLNSCSSAAQLQIKDILEAELDTLIPKLLKKEGVPGVSIAVIKAGKVVWAKGYGKADTRKNIPVDVNTIFQIGSVSKTLTAWGVMKLAEMRRINLDSPIDKYLKRWQLPALQYDNKQVTIRRVLSHTAGLSVRGYNGVFKPGEKLPTLEQSLSGYTGSDGSLHVIQEPGKGYSYSSGGYTLLQLMIEDVTGLPFHQYMQTEIFHPLHMFNTVYEWTSELKSAVATPYNKDGEAYPHYQFVEQGSGGIYTTVTDLARFIAATTSSTDQPAGRGVLQSHSVTQMIKPAEGTNREYGLGYKMAPMTQTEMLVSHDGANEGWRAAFYLHPSKGDGIVLLVNSDAGGKIGAPIICAVFARSKIDISSLCSTLPK